MAKAVIIVLKSQQKEMSNRIKARRSSLGFTQEQSAEIIGISYSSYVRIENAFQKPALDTLIKIAQHLNLSLDYLVFGSEEQGPKETLSTDVLNSMLEYADEKQLLYASEFLTKIAKLKGR